MFCINKIKFLIPRSIAEIVFQRWGIVIFIAWNDLRKSGVSESTNRSIFFEYCAFFRQIFQYPENPKLLNQIKQEVRLQEIFSLKYVA